MDAIEISPLGFSYIICAECEKPFTVMLDDAQDHDLDDMFCQDCTDYQNDDYYEERDYDRYGDHDTDFADPGGNSALRAETPENPRNLPCPNCGGENLLTPADRQRGYQCDGCADRAESGLEY